MKIVLLGMVLVTLTAGSAVADDLTGPKPPAAVPSVYRETSWASPFNGAVWVGFAARSSTLTEDAQDDLDRQADALKRYPTLFISVNGHADNRETADEEEAERLAFERARAVVDYLVQRGVSRHQLVPQSVGTAGIISVQETGRVGSASVNLCLLAVAE